MKEATITIKPVDKLSAEKLAAVLIAAKKNKIKLPAIPAASIKTFIKGKRENLREFTIDDEVLMTAEASKEDAALVVEFLKEVNRKDLTLTDLPLSHIEAFLVGERTNLIEINLRENK
jgi:hypothetical protein